MRSENRRQIRMDQEEQRRIALDNQREMAANALLQMQEAEITRQQEAMAQRQAELQRRRDELTRQQLTLEQEEVNFAAQQHRRAPPPVPQQQQPMLPPQQVYGAVSAGAHPQVFDMTTMMNMMQALIQQNAELTRRPVPDPNTLHYNVLPDLSHNVGNFDGLADATRSRIWLQQLETTATLHKWTEAIAFETARSRLVDAGKNWYLGKLDVVKDWKSFKKEFADSFIKEKSFTDRFDDMRSRIQAPEEKTVVYFFDKVRLCKALKYDFTETKRQVLAGLRSRETFTAMHGKDHFDTDHLLHSIQDFEATETTRKKNFASRLDYGKSSFQQRKGTPPSSQQQGSSKRFESADKTTSGPVNSSGSNVKTDGDQRSNVACFRCKATGHVVKDCPKNREIVCYKCNEKGHIARNCLKENLAKATIQYVDSEKKNTATKYFKQVRVDNATIDGLIDPGSSDCTIKASVVLRNRFEFVENASILVGFGNSGNEVKSDGIIRVNLCVDECEAASVIMRVVPDDVQPYDLIIGKTFTELPHLTYFRVDDKLLFKNRSNFVFSEFPTTDAKERESPVVFEQNVKLPPGSIDFVKMKFEENEFNLPTYNDREQVLSIKKGEYISGEVLSISDRIPYVPPRKDPIA